MSSVVPASRPKIQRAEVEKLLAAYGVKPPAILGYRGYYEDSMGVKDKNDRGIFDDAIVIVTPRLYRTFNGNTDPSETGGRLASLQQGAWPMKRGTHHPGTPKGYPCLVQGGPVTVLRDNGVRESGEFYIHVHHGGFNTTTSAGCQTIYRGQWDEFWETLTAEMDFYGLDEIDYVLHEKEEA